MRTSLKLVILYDAKTNSYTICDHNLVPAEAEKQVARLKEQLVSALAVEQSTKHRNADPQACRACRRDVERASGLTPNPTFQRRNDA